MTVTITAACIREFPYAWAVSAAITCALVRDAPERIVLDLLAKRPANGCVNVYKDADGWAAYVNGSERVRKYALPEPVNAWIRARLSGERVRPLTFTMQPVAPPVQKEKAA